MTVRDVLRRFALRVAMVISLCLLVLPACSSQGGGGEVVVRLRTDLVSGEEFDLVDVTLMKVGDAGPALHTEVKDLQPSYEAPTLLTEFRDISPGSYELLTSPRVAGTDLLASPQRTFVQVDEAGAGVHGIA